MLYVVLLISLSCRGVYVEQYAHKGHKVPTAVGKL